MVHELNGGLSRGGSGAEPAQPVAQDLSAADCDECVDDSYAFGPDGHEDVPAFTADQEQRGFVRIASNRRAQILDRSRPTADSPAG